MLSDRCLSCPSCLSCLSICRWYWICGVGVLWPNGWMDQDETWHEGRSRPRPHCVRCGPSSSLPRKGHSPPISGPFFLWPNGWMDQHETWHGCRLRPRRHCVTWGPSSPSKMGTAAPSFSAHAYCGQTVAHLSYC